MSQTSAIFFAMLLAFLVFITVKGELANYLWVLGLGGQAPDLPGTNPFSGSPYNPIDPTKIITRPQ